MSQHQLKLLSQAIALLFSIALAITRCILLIPTIIYHNLFKQPTTTTTTTTTTTPPFPWPKTTGAVFYEGTVFHSRKRPTHHSFSYPVRMAFIDLDHPPHWFNPSHDHHLTASQARAMIQSTPTAADDSSTNTATTPSTTSTSSGPVYLLTNPTSAGYIQNPISVYYCYKYTSNDSNNKLKLDACIAEVTNTPWGERVTFPFNPQGDRVPKSLHVSPLMDMKSDWELHASDPLDTSNSSSKVFLSVMCHHPQLARGSPFFVATLDAKMSQGPHLPNEIAGWRILLKYGFQPHRLAVWIYWHAIVLLWKKVPFYGPPSCLGGGGGGGGKRKEGNRRRRRFVWRQASGWPWR